MLKLAAMVSWWSLQQQGRKQVSSFFELLYREKVRQVISGISAGQVAKI
jgi:hypothetical protein